MLILYIYIYIYKYSIGHAFFPTKPSSIRHSHNWKNRKQKWMQMNFLIRQLLSQSSGWRRKPSKVWAQQASAASLLVFERFTLAVARVEETTDFTERKAVTLYLRLAAVAHYTVWRIFPRMKHTLCFEYTQMRSLCRQVASVTQKDYKRVISSTHSRWPHGRSPLVVWTRLWASPGALDSSSL